MTVTAEGLRRMSRRELDDLFRSSPAGPVPDGRARGTALVLPGRWIDPLIQGTLRLLVWRGKAFRTDGGAGHLRNLISPFSLRLFEARVYRDRSWFDGAEAVILDYSKSSVLVRPIRDEIRQVRPGLYLGQVFLGRRRVILFMLEFPGDGEKSAPEAPGRDRAVPERAGSTGLPGSRGP